MRRLPPEEIAQRVANSLEMVNLRGFEARQVTDLSGGEQQRVALARALATHPRLLMFDEPLGALDRSLREDLLKELRRILHQTDVPAVYVTHDQEEAFAMADRVLILHNGEIVRQGSPAEVWSNPGSAFVAGFLGLGTIFEGRYLKPSTVETGFGILTVHCGHKHQRGENVHLLARPLSDAKARVERSRNEPNIILGTVTDVIFHQDRFKITLDSGLYMYMQDAPKVGEKLEVPVKVECLA
jgi:ABC-type Fe3+/spermidine/putrescine transport system ATPase subunit